MFSFFRTILGLITRRRPKRYNEIVPTYEQYADLQKGKFCSYESDVPRWEEGQRRFIDKTFSEDDKSKSVLDIACGDGVGLREFRRRGFTNVVGVEFHETKVERAKETGYRVLNTDMHDLRVFDESTFDIIYSSHTIEHAYHPERMVEELKRLLKPEGRMIVVLPYPETRIESDPAHGAKYVLGLNKLDEGRSVVSFFEQLNLTVAEMKFDTFREPEIWLVMKKKH